VSLVAICFGLGMVLFTELNIDYSHNRTTTSSKIDITEEITIPVVNEDFPLLSDYQEIIDRPLFIMKIFHCCLITRKLSIDHYSYKIGSHMFMKNQMKN
jgi:hypothetical protein